MSLEKFISLSPLLCKYVMDHFLFCIELKSDWSFAEKTFVKQSMMLCLKFCLKLDDLRGGGKSYLVIWGVNCLYNLPPQLTFGHMRLFIWHLVSRVFWVKFLFLSQHLKREVGFFNFTTLLLIIYSLLQYNIHLCEICCCKCSKGGINILLKYNIRREDEKY